ncbi:PD-(D/E)XK motif protein [Mumia sp. zg.B53]|uniref:PD-(D/E)XK motif protein n=1 Tax=Mumia sp. zg.B53 TaxID=2855449 RepID=UPI001C6EA9A9|nr:PD-(D/E)XK motif protein [Mumia sp. zg.B53]MBW9213223.1 PD-(D/E)XK motif protein [Mumia sp. zg.B53]
MTVSPDDARHLTVATLDELWNSGSPMVLPIRGEPACRLRLDPKNRLITLVTPYESPEPDVANLKNIGFCGVSDGEDEFAELTVRIEDSVHGAYALFATVVDGLQIDKMPLAAAVAAGLARHRHVLASRGPMSTEKEVGLLGELLFLEFLIHQIGAGPATAAWQGPLSEEHDFTFDSVHVEVKTTSSDRRRHVIHGLDQLVPLNGVPLSVLSIQLTRTTPQSGRTLSQVVAHILKTARGHRVAVETRLTSVGWQADDADLYPTFWTLRSQPRAYSVTGDFPAITPDLISPVVPNFPLLSDVSYTVDLTDLHYDSLPDPMREYVESKMGQQA